MDRAQSSAEQLLRVLFLSRVAGRRFMRPQRLGQPWHIVGAIGDRDRRAIKSIANRLVTPAQILGKERLGDRRKCHFVFRPRKACFISAHINGTPTIGFPRIPTIAASTEDQNDSRKQTNHCDGSRNPANPNPARFSVSDGRLLCSMLGKLTIRIQSLS